MNNKKGFSLVEMVIVISIFALVASSVFVMFNETRNQAVLEDAQASVINALEQARSRAATGVGTTDHGVCIKENKIITFEGNSCPESGNVEELPPFVSTDKYETTTIIFNRLSSESSTSTTITLDYRGATATVSVTQEGVIEK